MPGMMDTVLNVGLHPDCVRAMAERTGNERGAWEAYLHFLRLFVKTVANIDDDSRRDERLDVPRMQAECERLQDAYRSKMGDALPTEPWAMLRTAINTVFASWQSERAIAYRKHHRIDELVGTAVNVQMMCPAEVAGVMFTANPVSQAAEIIIESAFGLGEAIVLGKVTPDRFVLDKSNLAFTERVIARKETRVATLAEDGAGQTGASDDASLRDDQVRTLAELGQRVEAHFQTACDIEWALSGGQFYLLQSRAIKFNPRTAQPIDRIAREAVRQDEIATLRAMAEPTGTVWSRFNLAEILPEPTPMTWAIVRQFMSGRGGFGQMYRDLGFDPDPALDEIGMFDLICGRPYCNLSREPRMQYRNLPFEHRFAWLKSDPSKALYPQATLNPRCAGILFFVKIPLLFFKMWRAQAKQRQVIRQFADQFDEELVPPYLAEVERAWQEDWTQLSSKDVLARMHVWIQRTLFDFARHSLKPTALTALMLGNLERAFAVRMQPAVGSPEERQAVGVQRAQAALRELVMGVHPDEQSDLPAGIRAVRERRLSRDEFARRFGHRGSQEMELARPRWSEDAAALDRLLDVPTRTAAEWSSADREAAWQDCWRRLAKSARLLPFQLPTIERELHLLQRYLALRESAKHYLLRGYALIRRALVELDRRYQLQDGIFFLEPNDLIELVKLADERAPQGYFDRIEKARLRRTLALSIPVPTVIFSDDLDAIGRELALGAGGAMQGVPLSAGIVEASAWVLEDVAGAQMPHEPYILVCPTTDPAWVPLFVHARGLVMETGGMLSHGAIVAREFGLPAVAGIADVHRRIKTGDRVRIDGGTGMVSVVQDASN
jgi:pyruvate,water dikinase